MPIVECSENGKQGYKFGDTGKCYTHDGTDAGRAKAKAQAVKQALAIGGGKAPADLSEFADDELVTMLAAGTPDGVAECTMGGNSGYRGMGGPKSACHLHDGTDAGKASAVRKALRDRGTTNPPPRAHSEFSLETVGLTGVPILDAGGPYHGKGSPTEGDYFDTAYLDEIVAAHKELGDEIKIPIKLGHNSSQKLLRNSGLWTDEMPAAGWVENLRREGQRLIGDLVGVPSKLADLVSTKAFRTRSVELSKVRSQKLGGKEFENVITGLALLGAKTPAVRTLDDIIAWYSDQEPARALAEGVSVTPLIIWATSLQESSGGMDTYGVGDETKTSTEELTDERITALAEALGIEEGDAAKRREAVLAKFAEHAPKPDKDKDGEGDKGDKKPEAAKAPDSDSTDAGGKLADTTTTVTMSADELAELKRDAALGKAAHDGAKASRITANIDTAVRQGRVDPKDRQKWIDRAMADEKFTVDILVELPVKKDLLRTFGSDRNGDGAEGGDGSDEFYKAFAAATSVPAHSLVQNGGKS